MVAHNTQQRTLSPLEYLAYLRDSYPQTRYSLAQWDSLYRRYNCTICDESWCKMTGGTDRRAATSSLRGKRIRQLVKTLKTGRYLACVNMQIRANDGATTTNLHLCNFLPLVFGSALDIFLRYGESHNGAFVEFDLSHCGQVYVFDRFWVFNSFIHTDSRQCHRYRRHTNAAAVSSASGDARGGGESSTAVRMYIYDKTGKGNMLYLTSNGALHLRDKYRREVTVVDENGDVLVNGKNDEDQTSANVVSTFLRDLEPNEMSRYNFFSCCREYMTRGIGVAAVVSKTIAVNDNDDVDIDGDDRIIPRLTDEIDHINNKRVSNGCALYCALLEDMARALSNMDEDNDNLKKTTTAADDLPQQWKLRIAQYAALSHRANLLQFISRRTHIRRDWCEVMKRYMKNEMRNMCVLTSAVTTVCNVGGNVRSKEKLLRTNGSTSSRSLTIDDGAARVISSAATTYHRRRYRAIDVNADLAKMEQQFLSPKVHSDVEYDNELVKRMRVVNLNAMSCLKMPTEFARFFSYFNVGNIGNAGRVMNRTHGMRDSFVCDVTAETKRVVAWLRSYVIGAQLRRNVDSDNGDDDTAVIFAVNEIPVSCPRIHSLSFDREYDGCISKATTGSGGRLNFWSMFLALKYFVPGAVITVVRLTKPKSSLATTASAAEIASYCVNVRLTNGVPTCPVRVVVASDDPERNTAAATYCVDCNEYYPTDGLTMTFRGVVETPVVVVDDADDAYHPLPRCRRHIWCSRHELTLYESSSSSPPTRPKLHEVACHGLLSVGAFPYATDASKLIVAINAHKRALEVRTVVSEGGTTVANDISPADASMMRDRLNACAQHEWFDCEQNGRLTRLTFFDDRKKLDTSDIAVATDAMRLTPRNAVRLLFAFGDIDMLNCEDGYVLNENVRIQADTSMCRKIGFSCSRAVNFRSRMTLRYTHDLGVLVHVGTFRSGANVRFFNTSNANVRVLERPPDRSGGNDDGGGGIERVYDLYVLWNVSYLQLRFDECRVVREIAMVRGGVDDCVNKDDRALLHERREYPIGPIGESVVELHDKYLRVILRATGTRQTIKLQNSFGQKGIAHYADLSDLVTDRGERVDLVSFMYSLLGRFACGQLLEQRANLRYIFSKSTGLCVGTGGYGYFFVSDDSAHNNFIYSVKHDGENPMRVCKLTYDSFLENGVSSGAYVKSSEFECGITNPYAGVPRNVSRALDCYGVYDRSVHLKSQTILNDRRRSLDRLVVEAIGKKLRRCDSTSLRRRKRPPSSDVVVAKSSLKKRKKDATTAAR